MNFISRHLNTIGILLLFGFSTAAAAIYFDVPQTMQQTNAPKVAVGSYVCPMHPKVVSDKPGRCPGCGMSLVSKTAATPPSSDGCGHHDSGCCGSQAAPHSGCGGEEQAASTPANTNATK